MTDACTVHPDRDCKEDDCCLIEFKLKTLHIPIEVKHDHSPEAMADMQKGIDLINAFLSGLHEDCVKHLVTYAELNIRAFFLLHLTDKDALRETLRLFIKNLNTLFLKNINPILGSDPI